MLTADTQIIPDEDDMLRASIELRAHVTVKGPNECWPCSLWATVDGHPRIKVRSNGKLKYMQAHRLVFYIIHRYLPVWPLIIRHLCNNPKCCNPTHLKEGTLKENSDDKREIGRMPMGNNHYARRHPEWLARGEKSGRRKHPEKYAVGDKHPSHVHPERLPRGEQSKRSKATNEIVREMRRLHDEEGMSCYRIGKIFGFHSTTVQDICARRTWKHVE